MAFGFFKDKEKGPLEVTCPLCQHRQQESRLAVSSYCRKCGAYLTFDRSGEVKARPLNPPNPFADRPPQDKVVVDYSPRSRPEDHHEPDPPGRNPEPPRSEEAPDPEKTIGTSDLPTSSQPQTSETTDKIEASGQEEKADSAPTSKSEHPPGASSSPSTRPSRYQGTSPPTGSPAPKDKIETRDVTCFECGDIHPANIHANSTQCRKCGRLIPMENRDIREIWSSSIRTRGNVHIHKKGFVRSAPIECHHLIVEGEFSGDARCSGDLIIRRNGKISGQIQCHRLLVERRAKVEFLGPVEMEEGRIDGLVNGNLVCRGLLALEKKAILTGNLKVGRLTIADGAKHNGQVRMGAF